MEIKTYGKQGKLKEIYYTLKNRFVISDFQKNLYNNSVCDVYIPKLNKFKFSIGVLAVLICMVIFPIPDILGWMVLLWSIK